MPSGKKRLKDQKAGKKNKHHYFIVNFSFKIWRDEGYLIPLQKINES